MATIVTNYDAIAPADLREELIEQAAHIINLRSELEAAEEMLEWSVRRLARYLNEADPEANPGIAQNGADAS